MPYGDYEERKAKLLRRAKLIVNARQLQDILESFPEEHRAELLELVRPLVRFEV